MSLLQVSLSSQSQRLFLGAVNALLVCKQAANPVLAPRALLRARLGTDAIKAHKSRFAMEMC